MARELWTMQDIAAYTGRAYDTVKRWRWRDETLPDPVPSVGRSIMFDAAEIRAWWAARQADG